jgi:dynein heavy chain
LLQAKDENSEIWKHYTESVDKLVVEGYHRLLQTSLNYFLKETDFIKNNPDPLFEIQLRLDPPEILFAPSLEPDVDDCFLNQIKQLVESVYKQTTLIKRIASHLNKENYEVNKFMHIFIYNK